MLSKFFKKAFAALLSFIGSLSRVTKASDCTKCTSLNNKLGIARPTLIDLNLEQLHSHSLMASLNKCHGNCNTLDDLSGR